MRLISAPAKAQAWRPAVLVLSAAFGLFAADSNEDLLAAARGGDLAAVKAALQNGAALEVKTPYGQTPLYVAAMSGHEDVVRFLLEKKGASVDITDTFYKAPMLAFVLQRKHYGVAKMLIPKAAAKDETLGVVAGTGKADLVQAVLEAGKPSQASLDKTYEQALTRKQAEVAELLKKAGAHEPAPPVTVDSKVLDSYAGNYRSEQMPIEVKVFAKEGKLYIQVAGQQELVLKAVSATRFEFTQAQLEIEFDSADSFTLKQSGQTYKFKKVVAR